MIIIQTKPWLLGADGFTSIFSKTHNTSYKTPVHIIGGRRLDGFKMDTFNGVCCFTLEERQTVYGMDTDTKIEKPSDLIFKKISIKRK